MFSQPILCDLAKILEDITGSCRTLPTLGQILAEDELAWSLYEYADLLLTRVGDRGKAGPMLDEALALATDMGMNPLMERILSKWGIFKV